MLKFLTKKVEPKKDENWKEKIYETLEKTFNLKEFRANQFEIVETILKEKRDCFCLMPTGGGKSLCYQLPAMILEGMTIVVSPLIALSRDQIKSLNQFGIKNVNSWDSSKKESEIKIIEENLETGSPKLKILYITPEQIISKRFQRLMKILYSKNQIPLVAIDEAHCISSWGHDFRVAYSKLSILKKNYPKINIVALTATATPLVKKDILSSLQLNNPKLFFTSFNRKEISYFIRNKDQMNPLKDLISFISQHVKECGIIYCRTKNQVDELVDQLKRENIESVGFHSSKSNNERKSIQESWIKGDVPIIIATIAFGMGIDRKDVRYVVHYSLPQSLESFYQESGRCGRDKCSAISLLYFSHYEKNSILFLLQKDKKDLNSFLKLVEYCTGKRCRRKFVLEYFGENVENDICQKTCDYCMNPSSKLFVNESTTLFSKTKIGQTNGKRKEEDEIEEFTSDEENAKESNIGIHSSEDEDEFFEKLEREEKRKRSDSFPSPLFPFLKKKK